MCGILTNEGMARKMAFNYKAVLRYLYVKYISIRDNHSISHLIHSS